MRSSRRLVAVPATAALVWVLAACSGPAPAGQDDAAPAPVRSASATPTPETPATAELTLANFVDTLTAAHASTGSYDFAMTMSAGGQEITSHGSANVADGAQEMTMVMAYPGIGELREVRLVGGLMYMNLGDATGGKFLTVDPADTSNPLSAGIGDMTGDLDPTKAMETQKAAITSVTKAGAPEQLNGAEVQRYEVVVDLSKLTAEQLSAFDDAVAAGVTLPETIDYTYWIDSSSRIHKVSFDVMGAATEMTFSNWGAGAPVVAPSADQITTENPFAA